jgi:uncharacterized protein (TIGR00299 family) protein
MTHLHFDCFSGISGDMILGALVDAGVPLTDLSRGLKSLRAGRYVLRAQPVRRAGMRATKVDVVTGGGFAQPFSLARIHRLIGSSRLPSWVKERGREVFDRLAKAEGTAHRVRPREVRFHEVGVVDSLVDVMGSLLGCHLLGVERVTASAVNLGSGMMDSSHGTLPVPGPAVAALVKGLPAYGAGPARELTTPTGLALLATLAREFGPLPLMCVRATGYGAGSAAPAGWPNVLRVFLGDTVEESLGAPAGAADAVVQLETNLDDLNPQAYEAVVERLFAAGAVDVTLTPVIMKRGRPGIVLAALTPRERAAAAAQVMLRETTTLGVRMQEMARWVLPRREAQVRTAGGVVRVKVSRVAPGTAKVTPEYRDCKRLADRSGRPVREILEEVRWVYAHQRQKGKGKRSGV